jgi:hypothetical protein
MCIVTAAVLCVCGVAFGQGTSFTYQGRLGDVGGAADDMYDFQFSLFSSAEGPGRLVAGPVEVLGVTVTSGLFTVEVDFGPDVFDGNSRWLEIGVRPTRTKDYTILAPRQHLTPVPYAQYAASAPLSAHDHWGESWSGSGTGLTLSSIGGEGLHAESDTGPGVYAESGTIWGPAIQGKASSPEGIGVGVYGQSQSSYGWGVYGYATSEMGQTVGVAGRVDSSTGTAVYGYAPSATGETYGVHGKNNSAAGCGVFGESLSDTTLNLEGCYGVKGVHHDSAGAAVYGETDGSGWSMGIASTTVAGVHGTTIAPSGRSHGVMGTSTNPSGAGVYGYNSLSGPGVTGVSMYGNPIEGYDRDSNMGMVSYELVFYVNNQGEVYADGNFHSGGADFAEMLPGKEGLEPGDVLVVDEDGKLTRSTEARQSSVVGVYSTQPGFVGGDNGEESLAGKVPLAIMGIVPVKVVSETGSIRAGDLLAASSMPGHAMNAGDGPKVGTVIGKALEKLDDERGVIKMLVMLQ